MIFGLRMTSFSNVRFGFAGKLGPAYLNYLALPVGLYILVAILLIGIILNMAIKSMFWDRCPDRDR